MTPALPFPGGPVTGRVVVPGSKSETNRALVLAALATGPSVLAGALSSRDSELMIGALRKLGVGIDWDGPLLQITPPVRFRGAGCIDCGLAGTVMRFVPPVAMLAEGPSSFVGDPHASERPMSGLLDGLRQLGANVSGDALPFRVIPPSRFRGTATIDASESSQYVSGLLLIGPRLEHGLTLRHVGEAVPSLPHIQMTVEMLRSRGVTIEQPDAASWIVAPGPISAADVTIEPDLTNASVFLAAAAVTGGEVTVPGWPTESLQPGAHFLDLVARMGALVSQSDGEVTVRGTAGLVGIDVDLHEASELTPVLAALAALAEGETVIRGVGHIRGHETDRLAALTAELHRAGIEASEMPDGIRILGSQPRATRLNTYADHRMVHFAALLGLRAKGMSVDDLDCVSKTMPRFPIDWTDLIA